MSYFVIIRGPLGVGKTTVSKKLSSLLDAEYFAVDKIIEDNNLGKDKEDGFISQKSFIKANEIVAEQAIKFLRKGKSVIFDGNFYWKSQINDLVSKIDFPHFVFTLKAPLFLCIERDSKRSKPYGKDAAEVVYNKVADFDFGVIIDATQPVSKSVEGIIKKLPV